MEALEALPPSRASAQLGKLRDSEIVILTRTVFESVKRTVLGTVISLSPKSNFLMFKSYPLIITKEAIPCQ